MRAFIQLISRVYYVLLCIVMYFLYQIIFYEHIVLYSPAINELVIIDKKGYQGFREQTPQGPKPQILFLIYFSYISHIFLIYTIRFLNDKL
jgi:hypothetical protein